MKLKATFVWLYGASFIFTFVECSNILAIFFAPSKSHHILGVNLAKGLIKRGHHVTLVSAFEEKQMKNFTHIQLEKVLEYKEKNWGEGSDPRVSEFIFVQRLVNFFNDANELIWEDPEIKKIVEKKPKYDAVILFNFFYESLMGLAHHLDGQLILFNPIGSSFMANKYIANPNMAYVANPLISVSSDNFFGRLITVTANIVLETVVRFLVLPSQQAALNKYLPKCPPLDQIRRNVSLVLVNSHYSIEPPRPYVPNMVQIGGYHVQDTNALPKEIQDYLDEAKDGVILFSMGSNVKVDIISREKRDALLKVFGEMAPMKIIFKSEITLENVPKNVLVLKWIPQADILAHPNIKVFISHGGLGGNTEAVYHGVPILGIPFFGDQKMNLDEAQAAGYAIKLEYDELDEESFRGKLKEIIEVPRYTANAKKRSALIKEQPVKPMDNAAFWIEHVIKYGGGSHLKNAGMDLAWYELYMVDIYLFYTLFICLILVISYYGLKLTVKTTKKLFSKKKLKNA